MSLPTGVTGSAGYRAIGRSCNNPIKRHADVLVRPSTPFWPALHHQTMVAELPKKTPAPAMQGGGMGGMDF